MQEHLETARNELPDVVLPTVGCVGAVLFPIHVNASEVGGCLD
jgi:hypothetical protein